AKNIFITKEILTFRRIYFLLSLLEYRVKKYMFFLINFRPFLIGTEN
ncbi:MAG: hypothetical protein ACI8YC_001069, partial [Salibacteraceae bacterium]